MQTFVVLAITVLAIAVTAFAGRAAWLRNSGGPRTRPQSSGAADSELVAVITAAIAASGREPGSFRVVGVRPSGASALGAAGGSSFARGLNTPAWGHVDRFIQGERS